MRNRTALTALLLASLALTGCQEGNARERENILETTSKAYCEANSDDSKPAKDPLSREECAQIVALLKAWGELDYNIHPDQTNTRRGDYFPECVNTERFLDEELTVRGGIRTYTERFYLIESGDFATEAGFNSKLGEMFTEGFKTRYMGSSSWQMFRFKDGEVYVAGFGHYNEAEQTSDLRLVIEARGDRFMITVSQSTDGAAEYTAVLEKTESGSFRIAEVGADDGSMTGIPWLFSANAVSVDFDFGEQPAFGL